jgi:serine/threonine-protein kinase
MGSEGDPTLVSRKTETIDGDEEDSGQSIGRYQLVGTLGVGARGTVYIAEQDGPMGFKRRVALKILHRQHARNEAFVAAFLHEARIAARLTHPNIVSVTDVNEEDGRYFLAMEFVDGCSARKLIQACPDGVPADIALALGAGVAAGLADAHGGGRAGSEGAIVHRDICPEKILIDKGGIPKIFDFGLARADDTAGPPTETGALRTRAGYAAPERLDGESVGPAADMWSLAVVLYELLTGAPLFRGRRIMKVLREVMTGDLGPALKRMDELDGELGSWMRRLLVRDPLSRFKDARLLAESLGTIARRMTPFDQSPNRRLADTIQAATAVSQPGR